MLSVFSLVFAASLWHVKTGAPVIAPPVVNAGKLLVGDTRGDLYAFDTRRGGTLWRARLPNGIWSAPLVYGSLAIVSVGSPRFSAFDPPLYVLAGKGSDQILAVDTRTGRIVWTYGLPASGASGNVIVDGSVIHQDGNGELLALDALTGKYQWRRFIGSVGARTRVVSIGDGQIAASGSAPNAVTFVRVRDGHVVARVELPERAEGLSLEPLTFADGSLYGIYFTHVAASWNEHLFCIEARTRRLRWIRTIGVGTDILPTRMIFSNGSLYAGSAFTPHMQAFRASDGAREWSVRFAAPSVGGAVVRRGVLYAGDASGTLTALRARDGHFLGALRVAGSFAQSAPTEIEGGFAIGSLGRSFWYVPFDEITKGKS